MCEWTLVEKASLKMLVFGSGKTYLKIFSLPVTSFVENIVTQHVTYSAMMSVQYTKDFPIINCVSPDGNVKMLSGIAAA